MSDDRLLGELVAFRRYTERELGELKKDVKALTHWKIKVSAVAAAVAALITYIMKG